MSAPRPSAFASGAAWRDDAMPPVLFVPGLGGSGPDHWQSRWAAALPGATRVQQRDWDKPQLRAWRARLSAALRWRPGTIIVAHSLGCILTAHLPPEDARKVAAALLVAPADLDGVSTVGTIARDFGPAPLQRLPFPSILVASRDDPFLTFDRARQFAAAWGSGFVDLGRAGHINAASGHGAWNEGFVLLRGLMADHRLERSAPEPRPGAHLFAHRAAPGAL